MKISGKVFSAFWNVVCPGIRVTDKDVEHYTPAIAAAIDARSEEETDLWRRMGNVPLMTAEDIGLNACTTIGDCLRRPSLTETALLFADLADLNVVEYEAYGEGEVPANAVRLCAIGIEVRKIVESWNRPKETKIPFDGLNYRAVEFVKTDLPRRVSGFYPSFVLECPTFGICPNPSACFRRTGAGTVASTYVCKEELNKENEK